MADEGASYELKYTQVKGRLNRKQAKSSILEKCLICLRELFGTAVYVFIGCLTNLSIECQGLTYAVLQACSSVSGTGGLHLNPVITTGATIAGKMRRPLMMIPMILAQFVGCLIGAGLHRGSSPERLYMTVDNRRSPFFALSQYGTKDLLQLCFGEAVLTCILVTVFLRLFPMTTRSAPVSKAELRNRKYIHALFVGLTIVALNGVLFQSMLIGFMNPFRAFGQMAVLAGEMQRLNLDRADLWKGHWIYWVGPILGGVVAGVIERVAVKLKIRIVEGNSAVA